MATVCVSLDAARVVAAGLRAKLDAAAVEVLKSGMDWAEGPYEFSGDDLFANHNPFAPIREEVSVKAGPVDSSFVPTEGWRVIRHADWVAAGKPGLLAED